MKNYTKALFIGFLTFSSYQTYATGSVIKIQGQGQFNQEILSGKKSAIVKIGAPWCGACKNAEGPLSKLASEYPNITFAQVEYDNNPDLVKQYKVKGLPTFLYFDQNGKLIDSEEGFNGEGALKNSIEKKLKPSAGTMLSNQKKEETASQAEQPKEVTEGSACTLHEQGFFERAYNATRDFLISIKDSVVSWFK